jgi:glycosyltransferase 2 family protein
LNGKSIPFYGIPGFIILFLKITRYISFTFVFQTKGMRLRIVFNILIYLSLIFLFIYIYRFDYLGFEKLEWKTIPLAMSVVLLWAGYIMSALSWRNILNRNHINTSNTDAIASHGLSIFAKYIPGKVWVILGRAGYIAGPRHSLRTTSFLSLKEQLIYVWLGLLISAIPILFFFGLTWFTIFVLGLLMFFTLLLFSGIAHKYILFIAKKITRKEWELPFVNFWESLRVIWLILAYWAIWMFGFYLLVIAFYPNAGYEVAFAFPLSVTLGLLAIIFPGGLGIREGIMTGYLIAYGISIEMAAAISIYARLWFISGEVFIFITALAFKWFKTRQSASDQTI